MNKKIILLVVMVLSVLSAFAQNIEADELIIRDWILQYNNGSIDTLLVTQDDGTARLINIADPVDGNDAVNLNYVLGLPTAGWDSLAFDELTGELSWWRGGIELGNTSLDDRYLLLAAANDYVKYTDSLAIFVTPTQLATAVSESVNNVYEITLPINGTLAGSATAAVEGVDYPTGWILVGNGDNLEIEHNLNRKSASVDVAYNYTGDWYRQIRGFNDGYQGHIYDSDNTIVEGIKDLYTAYKMRITILIK